MRTLLTLLLLSMLAMPAAAQEAGTPVRPRDENTLYMQGQRALNAGRWQIALDAFTHLAALEGTRKDAALYWMAYAHNRLNQPTEALDLLGELQRAHPDSLYIGQARALEVEVRRDAGQPLRPEAQTDQGLRMFALQGLLRSDPSRAVPLLDELLEGRATPRLKNRALFLLAQSADPQAQALLADAARGLKSPELQEPALGYVGASGTAESRQLMARVYADSADVNVKRRVLRALLRVDAAATLVSLARAERDFTRKREIVQALAQMRNNRVALDYLEELARQ